MPDPITATTEPVPPDNRPEPGPFPTLYLCTYWEWRVGTSRYEADGWRAQKSMFHRPLAEIQKEAAEAVARGCRNVRVVTIPGDQP